mmetsp:Transcript_129577/g.242438  ORF Transcript_129577/g.242438 Transcript_129577/m.242438 type:complete len:208 (-) Transcript_129577:198-821(-)
MLRTMLYSCMEADRTSGSWENTVLMATRFESALRVALCTRPIAPRPINSPFVYSSSELTPLEGLRNFTVRLVQSICNFAGNPLRLCKREAPGDLQPTSTSGSLNWAILVGRVVLSKLLSSAASSGKDSRVSILSGISGKDSRVAILSERSGKDSRVGILKSGKDSREGICESTRVEQTLHLSSSSFWSTSKLFTLSVWNNLKESASS